MIKPPFKCPFCKRSYIQKPAFYSHIECEHPEELVDGISPAQVIFNLRNKRDPHNVFGKSVISGKPTPFNTVTERYERFASPEEAKQQSEIFKNQIRKKYGTDHLMNDVAHQLKLLEGRSISGTLEFVDGKKINYVGSYEKAFLKHLNNLGFPSTDISSPSPIITHYEWEGVDHFYIPDFYIGSLDLLIEIKASDNGGYRARDIDKERAKDKSAINSGHKFLKIFDNDFKELDLLLNN